MEKEIIKQEIGKNFSYGIIINDDTGEFEKYYFIRLNGQQIYLDETEANELIDYMTDFITHFDLKDSIKTLESEIEEQELEEYWSSDEAKKEEWLHWQYNQEQEIKYYSQTKN